MSAIEQAIRLVSEPPGSLIYHLTLLFALWAALLTASTAWRRSRMSRAGALTAAAAGLVLLRGILMVVGALAWQGLASSGAVLPPLERAITVAGIGLLVWALALPRHSRLSYFALGTLLLLVFVGYVASATFWLAGAQAGAFYNGSGQETVWELASFVGLGIGSLLLAWHRPPDWGIGLGLLVLLALGHIVHYAIPLSGTHIAGAERLAELAALPLFAVVALRAAFDDDATLARTVPLRVKMPITAEKPRTASDPQLVNDLAALSAVDALAELGPAVTRAAARTLRADLSVVMIPDEDRVTATVPYGYDLIREQVIAGHTVSLSDMPALASALHRGKPLRLATDRHAAELAELAHALNAGQPGPALVVPLEKAGRSLGSILLLSPYAQHVWTPEDQTLLTTLAGAMTSALLRHETLAEMNRKHASTRTRLEEALQQLIQTQAAVDKLTQSLEEARARADVEHDHATSLAALIHEQGGDARTLQDMRHKIEGLQTELKTAQMQAAEAEGLRAELAQVRAAPAEAEALRAELTEHAATIQRLQAELAVAGAPPAFDAPDTGPLEQELRRALQENSRLALQLAEADQRLARPETEAPPVPGGASVPAEREVIASITQELRQPMSSIVGYTDLLLGESVGILGALQRKFLERVKLSTERMGTLLDDLIRVTAIDSGTLELQPEAVDVVAAIDDAITHSGAQFREKNITLRMDIAEDLPPIHADRDAMSQIMTHLLSNAASASRTDGEVVVSAHYQAEELDGRATEYMLIAVTDSGKGIAQDDRPRVFTRLYRADNPLIEGLGDTGVGLSIVKALVEAHGGRIWVDSEKGVGSTFSLLIPVETLALPQDGAAPS